MQRLDRELLHRLPTSVITPIVAHLKSEQQRASTTSVQLSKAYLFNNDEKTKSEAIYAEAKADVMRELLFFFGETGDNP